MRESFRNTRGYARAAARGGALGLLVALLAVLVRGRARWPALILCAAMLALPGAALRRVVEPATHSATRRPARS